MATIKTLSTAATDKLIAALKSAPPLSSEEEMAARIVTQVPSLSAEHLAPVIDTLYRLYYIRELAGVRPSTFLKDLMEGIRNNSKLAPKPKDEPKLESRLAKLLNIETLHTLSKAARLQRDGERLYCEAKILSDIRPVFGTDPAIRPVGAVLTHTLKVTYHEGSEPGDHREFHLILDSGDLEELGKVVQRAQAKDKTLRDLLKGAKLPNLGE